MTVNYIIVQEIKKQKGVNEAFLEPNDRVLPVDDLSTRLATNLNDRYNSKVINRAIFRDSSENETIFSSKFREFNSDRCEEKFIDFSVKSIKNLKLILSNVPFATGGYFVFIDYSVQANINYTSCFLVRNTDGLLFKRDKDTGAFSIDEQFHIDFEKLAVGCRVSLDYYNSNKDYKYLNFITGRNEPVSDYFKEWINAHQFEDEKADSHELIKLINHLPLPKDENGSEVPREEFKRNVFEAIKSSPNKKTVDLNSISRTFYGEEKVISDYVEENQISISTRFNARDSIIKKLVKFDATVDKIKLSFPYELLEKQIIYTDASNPDLIHIRSRDLAEKIRIEEKE